MVLLQRRACTSMSSRSTTAIVSVLAVGALLLLAWLAFDGDDASKAAIVPNAVLVEPDSIARSDLAPPAPIDRVEPRIPQAKREPAVDPPRPPPPSLPGALDLELAFVRPDHKSVRLDSAELRLIDAGDNERTLSVANATSASITGLAPGRWKLRVEGQKFVQREQTFDLDAKRAEDGPNGRRVVREHAIVWLEEWVAVVLRTSDGRPFTALAEDLGLEPRRLFANAFTVITARNAPAKDGSVATNDATLARFHPPPDYDTHALPGGAAGSLQLLQAPPFWVTLSLYGVPLASEFLAPSQREVVFGFDVDALEARFAGLRLRVVDASTRAPVAGAKVSLRADTSTHRRKDQNDVSTAEDGRLEFARIVPGRYELEVMRGESYHQQMIELEPAQRVELGDVAVGDGRGFDVLVVDASGRPAVAFVEIGPYARDKRTCQIFPAMMRHSAQSAGQARLPMPSGPAIVRAAVAMGRNNGEQSIQEVSGVRSVNVLIDPAAMPKLPLRLVLLEPSKVKLATRRDDVARIEVLDEFDVIVARASNRKDVEIELVPGRYRARASWADGSSVSEREFTVATDNLSIEL